MNEEDQTGKNKDDCALTISYMNFSDTMAAYSVVSGGTQPKFELFKAFMISLVTCKIEEDPIKMKALEC